MPKKISQLTTGTPIDADYFPYVDSTAVETKRTLWSVIKSTLKTYFDTLYDATGAAATVNTALTTHAALTTTAHGGIVPSTRTVAGHALSADVVITAADVSAVPTTRTVAGHALSADVAVSASDVGLGSVTNDAQIKAANFPASSVNNEIALFSSTTGKVIQRATGTGLAVLTSGVLSTVTAPAGAVVGTTDTQTLTNKRHTKRTGSTTSSATPTINTDNVDQYLLTAQTADITSFTTNLSGTPTEGQTLIISITGTAARAITWGATFESSTVTLPTTTVTTARLDVGFIWNTVSGKWRCVAVA